MYDIPVSVQVGDKQYNIRNKGDFRMVLDCFVALDDEQLTEQERILACIIIFYEDMHSVEDTNKFSDYNTAVTEMFKFFNCGQEESPGASTNYKLIDWQTDSQLISSAINQVAGKEIRAEKYIHWWTFMGYYLAVGESALSTVVNIRSKIVKGKKLEKYEQEFRKNNPQYFSWKSKTVSQREQDDLARSLWNSGK